MNFIEQSYNYIKTCATIPKSKRVFTYHQWTTHKQKSLSTPSVYGSRELRIYSTSQYESR